MQPLPKIRQFCGKVNQFIITTNDGEYFQSCQTIIAFRDKTGKVTLDRDKWDYLRTAGKYRNLFLGESIQDTRKRIKSGEYILAKLN